jgi:hypothetical protein
MKNKIFFLTIACAVLIVLLVLTPWRSLRRPISHLGTQSTALSQDPDKFRLRTASASHETEAHLLDGDFKILRSMNEVHDTCMEVLEGSFVTNSGVHASPGDILFANPGEAFQASDNIVNPDLPFRKQSCQQNRSLAESAIYRHLIPHKDVMHSR